MKDFRIKDTPNRVFITPNHGRVDLRTISDDQAQELFEDPKFRYIGITQEGADSRYAKAKVNTVVALILEADNADDIMFLANARSTSKKVESAAHQRLVELGLKEDE